jgi:hypothetical protein
VFLFDGQGFGKEIHIIALSFEKKYRGFPGNVHPHIRGALK